MIEQPYYCGQRVRVVRDTGTAGLVGLEGEVLGIRGPIVIVRLDADPAAQFRVKNDMSQPRRDPRRAFEFNDLEPA